MRINLKPKKFSKSQIERLSGINADLGIVMVAAIVLPSILGKVNYWAVLSGLVASLMFFIISIKLEKIKYYHY